MTGFVYCTVYICESRWLMPTRRRRFTGPRPPAPALESGWVASRHIFHILQRRSPLDGWSARWRSWRRLSSSSSKAEQTELTDAGDQSQTGVYLTDGPAFNSASSPAVVCTSRAYKRNVFEWWTAPRTLLQPQNSYIIIMWGFLPSFRIGSSGPFRMRTYPPCTHSHIHRAFVKLPKWHSDPLPIVERERFLESIAIILISPFYDITYARKFWCKTIKFCKIRHHT